MQDAGRYSHANEQQRHDAECLLDEFAPRMSWGPAEVVLDVGCGPGDVTTEALLPRLPAASLRRLVGSDRSGGMVSHAASSCSHPKVSFVQLDIGQELPHGRLPLGGFTKIFSFYCLHWVQEQRQALQNVHDLLAPTGEALLVFLARHPIYKMHLKMAALPRWEKYMKDVRRFLTPYLFSQDPAMELQGLLGAAGLQVIHCSCRPFSYDFHTLSALRESTRAVNPFIDRLPTEMQEQFMDECMMHLQDIGLSAMGDDTTRKLNSKSEEDAIFNYCLLVAHVKRPVSDATHKS